MFPVSAACVALGLFSLPSPAEPDPRAAAGRALPLLAKAAAGHVEQRACFACHNQAFPAMAFSAAKSRGFDVPADYAATQSEHVAAFLASNRDKFQKGQGTGGQVDSAGYALLTLELVGYEPDENTEAVAEYLLRRDADRDHWRTVSDRPPTEASDFTATFLALRGLQVWATDAQKERAARRVETARGWLLRAKARDTEDRVFRLLGLKEAGADSKEVAAAAWELIRTQRPDGGWAQLESMPSDPYATGTALVALHQAAGLATDHPAYARGVGFLLRTQLPDGSWYVKSRSKPFQPYYESGFPHGKDQFISAAASGWATTAIVLACAPKADDPAPFIAPGAKLEKLWSEGEFTEGPAAGPDGCVYFSDIGNRIMKFDPKTGKTAEFRNPSGRSNGLKFDAKGRLIACEGANTGGNRRVSVTEPDGTVRTLADKWEGKRFNSPNDLTLDAKGRVYFSDPRYVGSEPREIDTESVYRVDPDGTVTRVLTDVKKPNGLVISPDGKTLYVAESDPKGGRKLLAYPLNPDGSCGPRKELHDFGKERGIDGMTVASDGTIVATAGSKAAAGVYFFGPDGKKLGFLPTPEDPTNCCFAGPDRKTLYVTAGKSLYRINLTLTGAPTAPAAK